MQQSPSWDANRFSVSQEIPHILWNLNVHHHGYKSTPPAPILSQIKSVPPKATSWRSIFILISHLYQGLPSGLLTSVYPPKPCMHLYSVSYVLHAMPTSFFLITQIIFGEEYRSLSSSLCRFLHSPVTLSIPLRPKYSLSSLFSNALRLCSFLTMHDQVSHP